MNEMDLLTRLRDEVPADPVSAAAQEKFAAGLYDRRRGRPARRRWRVQLSWRVAVAGALSLAVAAGVLTAQLVPAGAGGSSAGTAHGRPSAAAAHAELLAVTARAAAAALAQPTLKPGQWEYTSQSVMVPPNRPDTWVEWQTADNRVVAYFDHGKLVKISGTAVQRRVARLFGVSAIMALTYRSLDSLPKQPAALLAYVENLFPQVPFPARYGKVLTAIYILFGEYPLLPPTFAAELFHALALIPHATVREHVVDMLGRHVIGLWYPYWSSGTNGEILLNPQTYVCEGEESFAPPPASGPGQGHDQELGSFQLRVVPVSGPGVQP